MAAIFRGAMSCVILANYTAIVKSFDDGYQ